MKKPILKTVSNNMQETEKVKKIRDESLNTAISQIEQSYGKGSIMKLGDNKENVDVDVVSTGSIATADGLIVSPASCVSWINVACRDEEKTISPVNSGGRFVWANTANAPM